MKEKRKDKSSFLLIFLCWLVYTCSYLGKYSYSSNTVVVISYYGVTKAEAGLVGTLFFIAYGAGQIINGIFCKYYPKKAVVGGALALSSAVNFLLFFDVPFQAIPYLWLINGMAQSVLWPTLVLTLGAFLKKSALKTAVGAMATTVAVGSTIAYGLSALFAETVGFKFSFLTAAAALILACGGWFALYQKAVNKAKNAEGETEQTEVGQSEGAKTRLTAGLAATLVLLALFAVTDNFVKDGLNSWMPIILKERYGLGDGLSIFLTVGLSIIGIFGAFTAMGIYKKCGNFLAAAGVLFAGASVCLTGVILLFQTSLWPCILLLFGFVSLTMHGINNIVTSMSPLYLRDKINPGLVSGLMNGACYVGSALSSYGLGFIADGYGWNTVLWVLLGVCSASLVASLSAAVCLRKKCRSKQK